MSSDPLLPGGLHYCERLGRQGLRYQELLQSENQQYAQAVNAIKDLLLEKQRVTSEKEKLENLDPDSHRASIRELDKKLIENKDLLDEARKREVDVLESDLKAKHDVDHIQVEEYSLSNIVDRNEDCDGEDGGPNRRGLVDVHFLDEGKLLVRHFSSSWDARGREAEKKAKGKRIRNQAIQEDPTAIHADAGGRQPLSEADRLLEKEADVELGHRIVFDTDRHYMNICQTCIDVSTRIAEISGKIPLAITIWSKEHEELSIPWEAKLMYSVVVGTSLTLWLRHSLQMTEAVIDCDKKYFGNFFADPEEWRLHRIIWIKLRSICKRKEPHEETQMRSFQLWLSIFILCAFGVSREMTDILTILHPSKAWAKTWPCHKVIKPVNKSEEVQKHHRIWVHWFPGERWEYTFEDQAAMRNFTYILVANLGIAVMNTYILYKARTMAALWGLVTVTVSILRKGTNIWSALEWEAKFKRRQHEEKESQVPSVRAKSLKNIDVYELTSP